MPRNHWKNGNLVRIGMGLDSKRVAKIVPMSKIKLDGTCTPVIGKGHYKPVNKDSIAIEFLDKPGEFDVHDKGVLVPWKKVFTLILPDSNREIQLGAFFTEGDAIAHAKKKFNADYLGVCVYPVYKRPMKDGEEFRTGETWTDDHE